MEAKHVTDSVGDALAQGLAEVVAVKPPDPIEYLGNWLKKHRCNQLERERARKQLEPQNESLICDRSSDAK